MRQYDPGHGDYTRERQDIFADLTIDTLLDAIDERLAAEAESRWRRLCLAMAPTSWFALVVIMPL